jgi:hypothetical protein
LQVELSRKAEGNETQALMRLKYHKRSVVIFASRVIPHAKSCGTDNM